MKGENNFMYMWYNYLQCEHYLLYIYYVYLMLQKYETCYRYLAHLFGFYSTKGASNAEKQFLGLP